MSRAFVREQDIEALEELPVRLISPHPNDVTDGGMKQLDSMLKAEREAHAQHSGGRTARRWSSPRVICAFGAPRRATARVLPRPTDTTEVRFGSSVSIRRSDGREETFRIVGEDEANPSQGTISHASPLTRALMGKGVGDVARLGTTEVQILAIR